MDSVNEDVIRSYSESLAQWGVQIGEPVEPLFGYLSNTSKSWNPASILMRAFPVSLSRLKTEEGRVIITLFDSQRAWNSLAELNEIVPGHDCFPIGSCPNADLVVLRKRFLDDYEIGVVCRDGLNDQLSLYKKFGDNFIYFFDGVREFEKPFDYYSF